MDAPFNIEADQIQKFLLSFGNNPNNEPRFRLVWTDAVLETRKGEFNEFYGSIFLRTFKGIREVPKYAYMKHRWAIEQWYPPELMAAARHEIMGVDKGSYEPIYVFEDSKRNALPLNKRVVEIIMHQKFSPAQSPMAIASRIKLEMEQLDEQEQKYFEEVLEVGDSGIASLLHNREAIVRP